MSFAAGIGVLALSGHEMTARWHLGPISGLHFWWVLVTSPEVLVFLFFMITDPRTAPRAPRARLAYAVALGLLASILIAPDDDRVREQGGSARRARDRLSRAAGAAQHLDSARPAHRARRNRRRSSLSLRSPIVLSSGAASATAFRPLPPGELPPISDPAVARRADAARPAHGAADRARPRSRSRRRGRQRLPSRLARARRRPEAAGSPSRSSAAARTGSTAVGHALAPRRARTSPPTHLPSTPVLAGYRLSNVAPAVGLAFRQGAFRYGVTNDPAAMMGGGLCWLDYNNDGWLDLFVVNSYGEGDIGAYSARGGLPRTALFRNDHGRFVNVTGRTRAGRAVRGEGCVAADFNGDGNTDLYVTTAQSDELLWNNGNGTFTEGARSHGVVSFGWHSGAAVTDVNGDGRPDLFVAGYTEANGAIPGSMAGYPTNHLGVRDLLFLNEGNGPDGRARFREVGRQAGDRPGAVRPLARGRLHRRQRRRPAGSLRRKRRGPEPPLRERAGGPARVPLRRAGARRAGVADANAGMGIAATGRQPPLRQQLARPVARVVPAGRHDALRDSRRLQLPRPSPRAGAPAGSTSRTRAGRASCSRTERSRSRGSAKDAQRLQVLVHAHGAARRRRPARRGCA